MIRLGVTILTATLLGAVSAESADCRLQGTSSLSFGAYDPNSPTPLTSSGAITLRCRNDATGVTVQLGRGGATTYFPRRMTSGLEVLEYNIFLDAALTAVWGDGTAGTNVYGPFNPRNSTSEVLPLFGVIFAGQNVPAGSYSDTVVITVNF